MKLLPVRLSEKQSEIEKFQRRLQKLESWRHITKSKYEAILKKWNSIHYQGMKILLIHLQKVCCHSYIVYTLKAVYIEGLCGARSALSNGACIKGFLKLSDHPIISRHLKGIFNRHPPLPKYAYGT